MPPAAASEKEESELGTLGGGAPQTRQGDGRPPAPPAEQLLIITVTQRHHPL